MKVPSKEVIIDILNQHQLGPLKRLGQNFLINQQVAMKMVNLVDSGEIVVEVGPGLGSLTIPLAKRVAKVIAVEKDRGLFQAFKNEFLGELNNVSLIEGDVLKSKGFIPSGSYSVLSNLPFYITSPTIRLFLENENPPRKMILMMQKEVAKRICSKPPEMSILAVSVQFYANPKIVFNVPRSAFWPQPEVDCSVVEITRKDSIAKRESVDFFKIVKAGFSQPRAQLLNNLSKGLKLNKNRLNEILISSDVDPKRRAESLSINEWLELNKKIKD